jgi:hypothetical protein
MRVMAVSGISKGNVGMSWLRMFAVAGVALVQVTGAMAADMPQLPPPPIAVHTGWYLRGDVGYNWGRRDGAASALGFTDPTDSSLGGGVMLGPAPASKASGCVPTSPSTITCH